MRVCLQARVQNASLTFTKYCIHYSCNFQSNLSRLVCLSSQGIKKKLQKNYEQVIHLVEKFKAPFLKFLEHLWWPYTAPRNKDIRVSEIIFYFRVKRVGRISF